MRRVHGSTGGRRDVRAILVGLAMMAAMAAVTPAASLAAGPGRTASAAPTIVPGVRYTGVLDNFTGNVNLRACPTCTDGWNVDLWRLPPLVAHDRVTVDWSLTQGHPEFEGRLVVAENVIDSTWGEVFEKAKEYFGDEGPAFRVSGSGAARSLFTTQQTSASGAYLEFAAWGNRTEKTTAGRYETFPYSFTLAAVQHYIGINFARPEKIATNTPITARAGLATGALVPDGMTFTLTASWDDSNGTPQSQSFTAQTNGGVMTFPLSLPAGAAGRRVSLAISRPADAEYQEARSEASGIEVVGPPPPPPPPPPGTAVVGQVAKIRHGRALLRLTCTGGPCKGGFKLRNHYRERRVTHRYGVRRVSIHKRIAVVGRSSFKIPAGQRATLSVPLSRKGRALLHRSKHNRLRVKVAGHGITSGTVILEGARRGPKHRNKSGGRGHGKRHHNARR